MNFFKVQNGKQIDIHRQSFEDGRNWEKTVAANIDTDETANLLAAAPELLYVCKVIFSRWELEPKEAIFPAHAFRKELQKAINKAEGKK